jgi:SAM-dependent methyltransferase
MPDNYYTHHADAYDVSSEGLPGDVEFYRDLAVALGGPVVELGVGTGRVAIPTAAAGIEVIGVDNAAPMLDIARRKAEVAGVLGRLHLVEGDMRTFTVAQPVPLVTIPYRSFLHNLQVADQVATLEACRRALVPGGLLALNVFNPDLRFIGGWLGLDPGEWEPSVDEPASSPVVRSTLRVRDERGARHSARIELRYVSRREMEALLERCGFAVEALYGDFARTPFTERSPEMIWLARGA